jgi:hypothetical protein
MLCQREEFVLNFKEKSMKIHIHPGAIVCMLVTMALSPVLGQRSPGITVGATAKTFQTLNPKRDASVKKEEINRLDTRTVFLNSVDGTQASRKGGILATNFGADGRVTLSIYLYDETKADGKGDKVYSCYSTRNSQGNEYVEQGDQITINDPLIPEEGKTKSVSETDIMSRLQAIYAAPDQTCKQWTSGHMNWSIVSGSTVATAAAGCAGVAGGMLLGGATAPLAGPGCAVGGIGGTAVGFFSGLYFGWESGKYNVYACAERYLPEQPFIAELTMKNATVQKVKIPGVAIDRNTADAAVLFGDMGSISVSVKVNGVQKATFTYPQTAGSEPVVDAEVGDEVTFEVDAASKVAPRINGMPDTWIARFAGEAFYYCSPSVKPGEYKPFLGFDSQVHGTAIRKFPEEWKKKDGTYDLKVPPVQQTTQTNGRTLSTWSWTVSREMDANKTTYAPVFSWKKSKTTPVAQRNNQREGLNMELLQAWQDWGINGLSSFSEPGKLGKNFIYGFDPDEILYFNRKDPATRAATTEQEMGQLPFLFRVQDEPWKTVKEGDQVPLNMMVSAYRKNRMAVLDRLAETSVYDGYEIQDAGTDATHPNGTGTGSVKAPGLISINVFNEVAVGIKLNVKSVLPDADKGFYSRITGTQWPAINEKGVAYSIKLPANASPAVLGQYYLQYDFEDNLGILKSVKVNAADAGVYNKTTGVFTARFDIQGWGYHTVTAYFKRCLTCKAVPVAGKELMDIGLRFVNLSTDSYKDSKDGAYIYLEEYRDEEADGNDFVKRYSRYVDKYNREYTFKPNQSVKAEIFDSDPHTFPATDVEWYLSDRAKAKRIPADSLSRYLITTLSPINGASLGAPVSTNTGHNFTFSIAKKGVYELKSSYRKTTEVYHMVAADQYPKVDNVDLKSDRISESGSALNSSVENREHILRLMKVLLPTEQADGYNIHQLRFTYSDFMFKDGPRANAAPHVNRFGRYNDYYNAVNWEVYNPETATRIDVTPYQGQLAQFLNRYATQANSADKNDFNNWYPETWLRHYSDKSPNYPKDMAVATGGGLQYAMNESQAEAEIAKLFAKGPVEPWQVRIPWVSWTDTEGPRVRTNIKVIIDTHKFFDNAHGAFSGNPNLPEESAFRRGTFLNIMTDDQKDLKEAYYDFKFGRKLLLNTSEMGPLVPANRQIQLKAYARKPDGTNGVLLDAFYIQLPRPGNARVGREVKGTGETIVDDKQQGMNAFPNPAVDKLTVTFEEDVAATEFLIIDAMGVLRGSYSSTDLKGHNVLPLHNLSGGTYILRAVTNKGIYARKFVVQK